MMLFRPHNLPDLTGLPREYRKAAGRHVWRRSRGRFWVHIVLIALYGGFVPVLVRALGYPTDGEVATICVLGGGGGVVAILLARSWVRDQVRYLREYLAATGHCPSCGYDLRGSPSGVCPECGDDADSQATKPPS
jgi:hypothetical protein